MPGGLAGIEDLVRDALGSSDTFTNYRSGREAFIALAREYGEDPLPTDTRTADNLLCALAYHMMESGYRASSMRVYRSSVLHFWRTKLPDSTIPYAKMHRSSLLLRHYTAISELEPLHRHPFPAPWLPTAPPPHDDPIESFAVLLGFVFFLRVSEYCVTAKHGARLRVDNLAVVTLPSGKEALSLTIRKSKTDLVGEGSIHLREATGCANCPVQRFKTYAATRPHSQPDAPALQWRDGRPFTDAHLNVTVKAIVRAHGHADDFFSSHSLRSGGASAGLAAGMSDALLMREGRWKSITSLLTYVRLACHAGAGATAALVSATAIPASSHTRKRHREM